VGSEKKIVRLKKKLYKKQNGIILVKSRHFNINRAEKKTFLGEKKLYKT